MASGEKYCRCPGCGTCAAHDQVREAKRLALGMAVLHQKAIGGNTLPEAQKVGLVKVLKALGVTKEELDNVVGSY